MCDLLHQTAAPELQDSMCKHLFMQFGIGYNKHKGFQENV